MSTLFNGWTESPSQTRERLERLDRLHANTVDLECTCSPNDDNGATACPACIEQARQRYSEIPYTAGDGRRGDSGSLSVDSSDDSIADDALLVTGIVIREG